MSYPSRIVGDGALRHAPSPTGTLRLASGRGSQRTAMTTFTHLVGHQPEADERKERDNHRHAIRYTQQSFLDPMSGRIVPHC